MITHRNFIANAEQVLFVDALAPRDYEPVALAALPMYHAYGQTFFVMQYPKKGCPTYIMSKFDFLEYLK